LFLRVVFDGAADRVLGQYAAVDLDRRQRQAVDQVGVPDAQRLVDSLALDHFRGQA
jgi:hypothetical protein